MLSEGMISLGYSWALASSQLDLGDIYCTYYSKDTVLCAMEEIGKNSSLLSKSLKSSRKGQLCLLQICHGHPLVFLTSVNGAIICFITKAKNLGIILYSPLPNLNIHFINKSYRLYTKAYHEFAFLPPSLSPPPISFLLLKEITSKKTTKFTTNAEQSSIKWTETFKKLSSPRRQREGYTER